MSDRKRDGLRQGFTLIEILVSVLLIAVVILGILQIRSRSVETASYIERRIGQEMENSLFFAEKSLLAGDYKGRRIDAYTLLRSMKIGKTRSLEILKKIEREVTVGPKISVGSELLPIQLRPLILRGDFSSRYYLTILPGKSP